jgi:hypothetical protein
MAIVFSGNNKVTTSGVLPIAQGGTGATTASEAINLLVPPQSGNFGKVLTTNGDTVEWGVASGGGGIPDPTGQQGKYLSYDGTNLVWSQFNASGIQPAGELGQLQYNFNNTLGATARMAYNDTDKLVVGAGLTDLFTIEGASAPDGTTGGTSVQIKGGMPFATNNPGALPPAGDVVIIGGPGFNEAPSGDIVFKGGIDSSEVQRIKSTGAVSFGSTGTNIGTTGQVLTSAGQLGSPTWSSLPLASATVAGMIKVGESSATGLIYDETTNILSSLIKGVDNSSILLDSTTGVISADFSKVIPVSAGDSGKYLTTDGTTLSWATVTAVLPQQSETTVGKVLTSNGTEASWVSALPEQPGNEGKFLRTDGSVAQWADFVLPIASATVLGAVKVDNQTIVVDVNGVLSATAALYDLPIAGVGVAGDLGGIKVGETLTINSTTGLLDIGIAGQGIAGRLGGVRAGAGFSVDQSTGVISMAFATTNTLGGIKVDGVTAIVDSEGVLSVTGGGAGGYTLPTATDLVKGGIKVGSNLVIDETTAVLSAVIPQASDLVLGGIKVGAGLMVDSGTGVMSVNFPKATTLAAGIVKVDGTTIVINEATGVISATGAGGTNGYNLPVAGTAPGGNLGGVIVGSGLSIDGLTGIVTLDLPTSSTTVLGGVKVDGQSIQIDQNGVISVAAGSSLPSTSGQEGRYLKVGATGVEWANFSYVLPQASTSMLGGVKVDGTTITVNETDGAISVINPIPSPTNNSGKFLASNGTSLTWEAIQVGKATTTALGSVSPDGDSIVIDTAGVISAKTLILNNADAGKLLYVSNGRTGNSNNMRYDGFNALNVGSTSSAFSINSLSSLGLTGANGVLGTNQPGSITITGGNAGTGTGPGGTITLQAGSGKGRSTDPSKSGDVLIKAGVAANDGSTPIQTGGKISFFTGATTTSTERLTINNTGSWTIATKTGSAGQPLVSKGADATPEWGTVDIAYGGTGATTPKQARTNLFPSQGSYSGLPGTYLTTDGVDVSWTQMSVDINPSTTGLTVTGGPVQGEGTLTLGGILALAHGGTGASTKPEALNNLLPDQQGQTNNVLISTGTNAVWTPITASGPLPVATTTTLGGVKVDGVSIVIDGNGVLTATGAGFGTVTSVGMSGGTTGLFFTGGPITGSGTITMTGTLAPENGGTGKTNRIDARNWILPDQAGNTNKALVTNGTTSFWSDTVPEAVHAINADVAAVATIADNVSGVVQIDHGGTGATDRETAINNLLPPQAGKNGLFLTSDGFKVGWQEAVNIPTSGVNGGVQYNNNGTLASSTKMILDNDTGTLTVGAHSSTFSVIGTDGGLIGGLPKAPSNITIRSGSQPAANGSPSSVVIQGGLASGLNAQGGSVFIDSGTSSMGAGGSIVLRTSNGANTSLVNRLVIGDNGAWSLGGDKGFEGQAIISQGADAPPIWGAIPASASSLFGDTLAANVLYSSLIKLGTLTNLNVNGYVGIGTDTPQRPLVVSLGNQATGIEFTPSETSSVIAAISRLDNTYKPIEISAKSIALRTTDALNPTTYFEISENGAVFFNADAGAAGKVLKSQGPSNPPTWGSLSINDVEGILPVAKGGTGVATPLEVTQALVNFGQLRSHTAVTGFSSVQQWGHTYVKGDTNGPGTGTEYYQTMTSLGSEYGDWSKTDIFAMQTAIPRNSETPYLSVRYKEGGSPTSNWTTWKKIYAGYADAAQTITGILPITKGGTGSADRQTALNNLAGFSNQTNQVLKGVSGTGVTFGKVDLSLDTTGVVPLAKGGTGAITQQAAINALVGGTWSAGKVLRSDGTNTKMDYLNLSTDTTGVVPVTRGGTGGTTPFSALQNLLPTQNSNVAGRALVTNGTNHGWQQVVTSVNVSGGTTGLTTSGGPVVGSGTITLGGQLKMSNGGTGRGNFAKGYIYYDGTASMLESKSSINVADLSGAIAIANGGTGSTTKNGALNNLLPTQSSTTGNANYSTNKYLRSNGSNAEWATVAADLSAASGVLALSKGGTGATSATGAAKAILQFSDTYKDRFLKVNSTGTAVEWANVPAKPGGTNTQVQFNDNGVMEGDSGFTYDVSTQVANFTKNPTIGGNIKVGYLNLPRVTTFNTSAIGKRVVVSTGFTVPANTYAAGDAISFYNDSANAITIVQGSGMTLRKDGTPNTGNFTLNGYGTCFLWFNSATEAILSGTIT